MIQLAGWINPTRQFVWWRFYEKNLANLTVSRCLKLSLFSDRLVRARADTDRASDNSNEPATRDASRNPNA